MPKPPILECYEAYYSSKNKLFHIILPDLSDTHFILNGLPSERESKNIIKNYAKIHSIWWNNYKLYKKIKSQQTIVENYKTFLDKAIEYYPKFIDFLGDIISTNHKEIYKKLFYLLPEIWENRFKNYNNFTIIQQDANFGNVLIPKNEGNNIYIIDWQFWRLGLGVEDLVCLLSLSNKYIFNDIKKLLKDYICHLNEFGIYNYDYDNCLYDYKMTILKSCLNPIYQFSVGLNEISKIILKKAFESFKSFNCGGMF